MAIAGPGGVDDAIASGARALFGEKYGDEVRVVSVSTLASGLTEARVLYLLTLHTPPGQVLATLDTHADAIGHVHTAGNPGRGELDDTQEIDYPAVMRALTTIGYHDFVAHEFLPTWDDPILSLRHAAMVCDV
jgi:hydroxypyruvate isomerase